MSRSPGVSAPRKAERTSCGALSQEPPRTPLALWHSLCSKRKSMYCGGDIGSPSIGGPGCSKPHDGRPRARVHIVSVQRDSSFELSNRCIVLAHPRKDETEY